MTQLRPECDAAYFNARSEGFLPALMGIRILEIAQGRVRAELEIRRELFGARVQSTANLFGREGSGALFWRDQPFGTPVKNTDKILLTDEGKRIAGLWRALHPAA